jgi:hypothetical protein
MDSGSGDGVSSTISTSSCSCMLEFFFGSKPNLYLPSLSSALSLPTSSAGDGCGDCCCFACFVCCCYDCLLDDPAPAAVPMCLYALYLLCSGITRDSTSF